MMLSQWAIRITREVTINGDVIKILEALIKEAIADHDQARVR